MYLQMHISLGCYSCSGNQDVSLSITCVLLELENVVNALYNFGLEFKLHDQYKL